jgi:hypothetical protein
VDALTFVRDAMRFTGDCGAYALWRLLAGLMRVALRSRVALADVW